MYKKPCPTFRCKGTQIRRPDWQEGKFVYWVHQVFIHSDKIHQTLLFSRTNRLSSPSLSSNWWHSRPLSSSPPFAALAAVCPCLFCTEEPSTGPSTQGVPHQGWAEGEHHLSRPAGDPLPSVALLPMLPTRTPGAIAHRDLSSLWLTWHTRTMMVTLSSMLSQGSVIPNHSVGG